MASSLQMERVTEGIVRTVFLALTLAGIAVRLWLERQWLGGVVRHVAGKLCPCLHAPKHGDLLEDRVRERCRERRLQRAQMIVIFAGVRFLVKEVSWLLGMASGEPTVPPAVLVLQHALGSVAMLLCVFPGLITSRSIHVFYAINMCSLAFLSLVGVPATPMETLGPAFFWCLFNLLPWLNVLSLTLQMVACMSRFWLDSQTFAYYDWISILINACMALVWIDSVITFGIRLEIIAQDSSNELRAVKRLLGTICDVVVELDSKLNLVDHSPRLSDILILASGRSLQGLAIQEFMPDDDDRQKFVQLLQSSSSEASSHADVFHAKLRDSTGSNIAMEFFSVQFGGPDTCMRHLLGMREFTDIHPLTPSPEQFPPQPMPAHPGPAARQVCPDACRADVQSDAVSLGASDNLSQCSDGDGPKVETHDVAKKLTIASTLMGWSIKESGGGCCPWHLQLAESRRVVDEMVGGRCQPGFRPVGKWQCRHCGIAAKEYRDRALKDCCLLCKDVSTRSFRPETSETREVTAL